MAPAECCAKRSVRPNTIYPFSLTSIPLYDYERDQLGGGVECLFLKIRHLMIYPIKL